MIARSTQTLDRSVLGGVLIAIAAVVVLGRLVDGASDYTLAAISAICLVAFAFTRSYGYAVATGITGGLGLGVVVAAGGTLVAAEDVAAAFLGALALGFVAVWLLGRAAQPSETDPWPLVPAAILGTIGLALATRTPALTDALVAVVAIVLVVAGVRTVVRARRPVA